MNDDKLECLRLAIEIAKINPKAEVMMWAKEFYNWVYNQEKTNSLTFDKISKKRE